MPSFQDIFSFGNNALQSTSGPVLPTHTPLSAGQPSGFSTYGHHLPLTDVRLPHLQIPHIHFPVLHFQQHISSLRTTFPHQTSLVAYTAWDRFTRIIRLLLLGYATQESQFRYERTQNWRHFHSTLMRKLENVGVVSGLLLAANTNLLCAGPKRNMTYTSVMASICCSILSVVFGLLCSWSLVGVHPTRLQILVRRSRLFYYLHGTPSLFGAASALTFFVAIGAWTWFEVDYGLAGKLSSVMLSAALLGNVVCCTVLGATTWETVNASLEVAGDPKPPLRRSSLSPPEAQVVVSSPSAISPPFPVPTVNATIATPLASSSQHHFDTPSSNSSNPPQFPQPTHTRPPNRRIDSCASDQSWCSNSSFGSSFGLNGFDRG